jgi:hypothetical protein
MRRGPEDSNNRCCAPMRRERRTGKCGANLAAGSPFFQLRCTYSHMLIRLDDNTLVDDLCAHYRRSGFRVEHMGGGMVDVARENAPTPEQERHEVLLHLRVWEAVNPDTRGELLA